MNPWRTLAIGWLLLIALPARAQEAAVTVGASYVTDLLTVVDGGRRRGGAWLGRADLTLAADGSVIWLDGANFYLDILATQNPDFSGGRVGDAQTVSNVQADSALRPFEAWVDVPLGKRLRVKAGLIDLNGEFDIQRVGAMFLNSAHGIGPDFSQSGANGPSIFPASATAVVIRWTNGPWTARVGLFDAVAGSRRDPRRTVFRVPGTSGALLVAEAERRFGDGELQLGAWRYTPRFAALAPGRPRAPSQGAYALIEGPVARQVEAWLRIGIADDRANPIGAYIGGGITIGPERSRIGLAVAHARLGAPGRGFLFGQPTRAAETAIELNWAGRLTPGVIVQPDLQYIIHPGWEPGRRNALVAGVRLRFRVERGLFAR